MKISSKSRTKDTHAKRTESETPSPEQLNLTPKQLRVLLLVRASRKRRGYSPTMQELADELGVSKVTVFEHVEALIGKGALVREPNKARSLSVAPDLVLPHEIDGEAEFDLDASASARSESGDDLPARQLHDDAASSRVAGRIDGRPDVSNEVSNSLEFPLVGRVAAGHPIEKFENRDTLSLAAMFAPNSRRSAKTFALKVDGMSMRDEGILDGDFVLLEQRATARNGERVVALLPNGETTLKTYHREKDGRIRLQPANPEFQPIFVDDCAVQGVVVGVVRSYN
jgi:repressor LexA